MTRALALGHGALYGGYSAGVAAEFARELGEYFDEGNFASVGVFAGTYSAARQPDDSLSIWCRYVHRP